MLKVFKINWSFGSSNVEFVDHFVLAQWEPMISQVFYILLSGYSSQLEMEIQTLKRIAKSSWS